MKDETDIERKRIVAIVLAKHEAKEAERKKEIDKPATPKKLTKKQIRETFRK